jgi:hypothetical protein
MLFSTKAATVRGLVAARVGAIVAALVGAVLAAIAGAIVPAIEGTVVSSCNRPNSRGRSCSPLGQKKVDAIIRKAASSPDDLASLSRSSSARAVLVNVPVAKYISSVPSQISARELIVYF